MKRKSNGIALYIHIPFCIKKCNYCDFVSFNYTKRKLKKYVECLKNEMELYINNLQLRGLSVSTLYFGGGTPSLLSPEDLYKIIKKIKEYFNLKNLEEVTIEANPETIELEKFKEYRSIGINRVSIGAQSFNDTTLKILGRVHNSKKIYEEFYVARKAGFTNVNLDLMFALPGERLKDTMFSLKKAILLNPEHISYYSLMIEEGTPFFKMQNRLSFPDNDTEFAEYEKGIELLEKNKFKQYEISNFAKIGFESKHNLQYWRNLPYLGFGVSAVSYIKRKRSKNISNIDVYCKKIENKIFPIGSIEHLVGKKAKAEYIIISLRTVKGCNKNSYYLHFGTLPESDFSDVIKKLKGNELLHEDKEYIALTKKGIFIANNVFEEFLP